MVDFTVSGVPVTSWYIKTFLVLLHSYILIVFLLFQYLVVDKIFSGVFKVNNRLTKLTTFFTVIISAVLYFFVSLEKLIILNFIWLPVLAVIGLSFNIKQDKSSLQNNFPVYLSIFMVFFALVIVLFGVFAIKDVMSSTI